MATVATDALNENVRNSQLGAICSELGTAFIDTGAPETAVIWFQRGIEHVQTGKTRPNLRAQAANLSASLAAAYYQCGKLAEAETAARSSIESAGANSDAACAANFNLGLILKSDPTRRNDAILALERAVQLARARGASHINVLQQAKQELSDLKSMPNSI